MRISDWSSDVCSSDLYVIGARNLTDRTETTIVERKVDQNPERIIGVAREPQPPLPRETSSNTGYLYIRMRKGKVGCRDRNSMTPGSGCGPITSLPIRKTRDRKSTRLNSSH